jgi:pimeloyl-ACP methyl ester carboxylesterase
MSARAAIALALLLAAPAFATQEESVALPTPTGRLYGALLVPEAGGLLPLAIVLAGSGPTDRDGNNPAAGHNDSLKLLAQGLAERGIATLRYDKRGIAASQAAATREEDLRFSTYVDDAVAWAAQLGKDARFRAPCFVGHSEGALVATLAAQPAAATCVVAIAGTGRKAGALLREQLAGKLPAADLEESERILASLEAGKPVPEVPAALAALYRPSVQPYLISWLPIDPAAELAKLAIPVLIAQGSTDLQVSVADAKLLAAAQPAAKLVVVEGMNHVLKTASGDLAAQRASYTDPSLPIVPALVEAVAEFVAKPKGP